MPNVYDDDEENLLFADESEWMDDPEDAMRPGPGQAEDNVVNPMACGHELDDAEQLAPGTITRCSVHGKTYVTDGKPYPRLGMIGQYVIQTDDDSPVPLAGVITGRVDADRVVVVWDALTFRDLAGAMMMEGRIEFMDQLTPRN